MAKRIAVVTGGMGGIGQAICKELHDQRIRVVAGYHRKEEAAFAWQKEKQKEGYHFDIALVNVADFQSCEDMAKQVESDIGPVDILVNNAGIAHDVTCSKMAKEDWDSVINTDLSGVFYMTRALINTMKQRKFGRIINISSINGQRGQFGQVNYSAAKAGMHGFTKALAREIAKYGITVNTISPGYVTTDMIMAIREDIRQKILADIPMGRFAEPDDVARLVAFLADDKNSYITGTNISVNGGHYMC
jgi:acetoacetyl-CoA reductase